MQPVVPMPTRTRTQRDAAAAAADEEMSEISPDGTDWFIVAPAILLVVSLLVVFQLETLSLRPNFVKSIAYTSSDRDMQYKLGAFYLQGLHGLKRDHQKARAWFQAAAEQGHRDASLHLGYMHYKGNGGNVSKPAAFQWLSRAARSNVTEAQYRLGYMYYQGDGVPRNEAAAARWFRTAAEKRHAGSAAMVGYLYFTGRGLPPHNKLALLWFRRAAELGDAPAMVNLGMMHYRGKGTARDYILAYMWFLLAERNGDLQTQRNADEYTTRLRSLGKISEGDINEAKALGEEWSLKHNILKGLSQEQGLRDDRISDPGDVGGVTLGD